VRERVDPREDLVPRSCTFKARPIETCMMLWEGAAEDEVRHGTETYLARRQGNGEPRRTTIPPRVPENPAYRKPTHALHHNNVNICQETLKLSEYTLHTLALVSTYPLLLLSSVALTIPYLVVDVQNSLSSVSLGRAL
jgi:hypothetical protein